MAVNTTTGTWGFPESVAAGDGVDKWLRYGSRSRTFPFLTHLQPSIPPGTTRVARISSGYGAVGGMAFYNAADVDVTLPTVTSGVKYFLVGAIITWGATLAECSVTFGYRTGTSARALPTFEDEVGTAIFLPIALARVDNGKTLVQELVDLRGIAEEPGVYTIYDDLALLLIDRPGASARNASTGIIKARIYTAGGNRDWVTTFEPVTTDSGFLNSGDDWSTAGFGNAIRRFGPSRTIAYAGRRFSQSPIPSPSNGNINDKKVFQLSFDGDKPPSSVEPIDFMYYTPSGAKYEGQGRLDSDGWFYITNLTPNQDLRGHASAICLTFDHTYWAG